ncbi:gluconokinase [Naasia aerilata]|uniref:Gluconokinase n=1 Tax=Naasia aerilata TaxID=1162966 RepID=A0ABM8G946_9MICO|nr:gluconokinase [Naasia aerilata]BDZ44703.1 gluconokinase [Naasia aerilata]
MPQPLALVVMGVSGCGKSTVGELLAQELQVDFLDADDLHTPEHKAKMHAGIPLTDADRRPWLATVGAAMKAETDAGRSVVVACSALRRIYRDALREAAAGPVFFVHLHGSRELLESRLGRREGHFMPPTLLDSQLATLEPLEPDEAGVVVDIALSPQAAVDAAVAALPRVR